MILRLVFCLALLLLMYAWALYPLLVLTLARFRRGAARKLDPNALLPAVCVLISAHNEEKVIVQRLQNLIELDYPADAVRVYLGVDGSDDRTAELARRFAVAHPIIHVYTVAQRRGKMAMLKDLVRLANEGKGSGPTAQPSILVFSDANTMFERGALKALVSAFGDPAVGGVCGQLVFHRVSGAGADEGRYWRLENALKEAESRLDSCLGANGAIYAIRQPLFWREIPDNTIIDDFVIGMKVREQGRRMVYAVEARAHEDLPETVAHEWRRRTRIGAGDYQALSLCRRCLLPRYGGFAWVFFSHKVLRWFTPHLLLVVLAVGIGILVSTGRAATGPGDPGRMFGAVLGVMGLTFLLAGALGYAVRDAKAALWRPFRFVAYFLTIQAALFVGFLRYCRGNLTGQWVRTPR